MLPQQYPSFPRSVPQKDSAFQFHHRYLPTGAVGGDFFTISALSDNEAAVFICDVAGHGARSALVTAMIRALVEELTPFAAQPGQFLTKLNTDLFAILKHTGTPLLTTAFYVVADWTTGHARYANAGHPKPLLLRRGNGRVEPLPNASGKSQPALGLFEDARFQASEVDLARGDMIMLFTDGLYEVQAEDNQLYTQDLLVAAVQQRIQLPARRLFDEILDETRRFSGANGFSDDVCLVSVELSNPASSAP
jgi:sigma-B regulation protein RsbU (phosphoserine phosphatase)